MNELSKHIIRLLEMNECVILPGLGGFVTTHVAARYEAEKGIFMPPFRTLAFQPGLTTNDGLLVQSYMESEDLAYPDAVTSVERKINDIKVSLAQNGFYDLEGIGRLSQDVAGHYYFSAATAANNAEAPEFYGLKPVNMPLLPSMKQPEKTPRVEVPVEAYPFYSKKGISIHFSTSTINKMAGIVVMFLLVFLFATPFGTLKPVTFYSGFASALFENDKPASVPRHVTVAKPAPAKDTAKAQRPASVEPLTEMEDRYCIVLASGVTHANAEAFISHLAQDDIKASLWEKGKMRRVVYSSFQSKEAAQKALRSLRNEHEAFATAWVMKD